MTTHTRVFLPLGKLLAASLVVALCPYSMAGAADAFKNTDFLLKAEVSYQADEVRDPFKSYLPEAPVLVPGQTAQIKADVPLPELKVSGIFWGAEFPQAIINGIIVKSGDIIADATITKIEPEGVTVNFNRRDYLLRAPAAQNLDTARGKKEAPHGKSRNK